MIISKEKIEAAAEKYVQHCRDNWHAVEGIAEAYCMADFKAGADFALKEMGPVLAEIEDAAEECLCILKGTFGNSYPTYRKTKSVLDKLRSMREVGE